MNDKLAAKIAQVQKLINLAEQVEANGRSLSGVVNEADNAHEAAAYRAKAEQIMREYRIEEEQLMATDQVSAEVQMHSLFGFNDYTTAFYCEYITMMYHIADHCGIEFQGRRGRTSQGEDKGCWFDMFGYEGDLRMAEWLWSSARLVFGSHLEPQVDPKLSDQVNAYNLRQAGILRKDIARKLWGENTPANRSRAQRLYVAECKVRGEQPALSGMGTDADTYRDAYAEGFVSRLGGRLRAARDAADSTGGRMVLAGRAERIREALYTAYPDRRPRPRTDVAPVDTTPVKPSRRKGWTAADERAYRRRTGAAAQAGMAAGGAAAAKVEIGRDHGPARRLGD